MQYDNCCGFGGGFEGCGALEKIFMSLLPERTSYYTQKATVKADQWEEENNTRDESVWKLKRGFILDALK